MFKCLLAVIAIVGPLLLIGPLAAVEAVTV